MYLIRNIYVDHQKEKLQIEKGIQVGLACSMAMVRNEWWGSTDIRLGEKVDHSKITPISGLFDLLSYANKYEVEDMGDGFKKIILDVNEYEENNIEGYIVFIRFSYDEIKTSGKKLFGRFFSEMVAVLKEGDFIEFDKKRIEVSGGRLKQVL